MRPAAVPQVLPGSRLPADGEVIAGNSFVDEAMLTGESAPVPKSPGDHVISGTVNQVRGRQVCRYDELPIVQNMWFRASNSTCSHPQRVLSRK